MLDLIKIGNTHRGHNYIIESNLNVKIKTLPGIRIYFPMAYAGVVS